jgi:hypothetical protein
LTIWHILGGVVLLLLGGFLWLLFLGAQGLSVGFGGGGFSPVWFLIPAAVTFGGPTLMWWVLPRRRRQNQQAKGQKR